MTHRMVKFTTLADGSDAALHLHEIVGKRGDGPTVGISGAIHGDEPTGTRIIMEIARRLGGGDFRGRLLLLPVANALAYQANRRNTPLDAQNLNRLFPGSAGGWYSEQLALAITKEFLDKVDVLLDLHSGGDRPTVDYIYICNDEGLSRAFLSPVLYQSTAGVVGTMFHGTTREIVEKRGAKAVTVELGGGRIDQSGYVTRGVAGIENILRTFGMLDGAPAPLPAQTVCHGITTLRPTRGGVIFNESPPLGQRVAAGAVLGRIVSPYTFEELEVIRNPVPNGVMILAHLTANIVEPGDYLYMVGHA
ncbi:MAG: succinate dehydrogenase [Alphaproteobacteria bacterium]|nr:succinate dehydrogenase [Alphaproteobacteria bacterium]